MRPIDSALCCCSYMYPGPDGIRRIVLFSYTSTYGPILDMASRSIPRFKAKLGGFFKSRAEEDRLDSSKYVSTPRKPSRSPQPQGNPAPASQLALQPSTVAPLEVVSASTVTDDVAITGRLPEERSEPAKKSLWDRAYDGLKEENARLVQEYEELLSKELQADGASDDGMRLIGVN